LPDILTVYFGGPGNNAPVIRFDIDSDSSVFSTPTGTTGFNDMALTSDGRYLTYRSRRINSPPGLFEIDPTDGTISLLIESEDAPEGFLSLTALSNGDLLGYGRVEISPGVSLNRMLRMDPDTLEHVNVPISTAFTPGALATSPNGQVYLWAVGSESGSLFAKLYTMNPFTGSTSEIGGLEGITGPVNGFIDMAFTEDGRLLAFTEINASPFLPNSVYEIDIQTGIPTFVSQPGEIFSSLRGVEFLPIPEPSSLSLCVSGLLLMFIRRFRSSSGRLWGLATAPAGATLPLAR
jgi:hypothetical protein